MAKTKEYLRYYKKIVTNKDGIEMYNLISIDTKEILCSFPTSKFKEGLTEFINEKRKQCIEPVLVLDYVEK